MPLTYDLDIAATKFCHGLADGEIPLLLLFAGTVYYQGEHRRAGRAGAVERGGDVPAAGGHLARGHGRPLPRLHLHPAVHGRRWTRCAAYRSKHVITTWDETLERLLKEAP